MDPSPAPARWPRLTIGRVMLAVAILGVGLKIVTSIGSAAAWEEFIAINAIGALVVLLLATRAILVNPAGSLARRRALSWTRACLAVYLPWSEGFLILDCRHCLGVWAQIWPVVPGMPPALLLGRIAFPDVRSDVLDWSLSGCFTLAMIATAAVLGMRGRVWMWGSLAVCVLYSLFAAVAIASLIRS